MKACRKNLSQANKLNNPEIYDKAGIFKIPPFIISFKAINSILQRTFP